MEKKHGQRKNVNIKVVVSELHRAFKMFNENLFNGQLPEPAILIQSRGNKKLTLGWCSVQKIWKNDFTEEEKYEINIVAEALNRGIYPVMTTLLHEMVHLHNLVNEIKDTSRGNTYHNMKFKQTAEQHGLEIEHAEKIGWSVSKLNGFAMDIVDEYNFDEAVFSLGRRDIDFDGAGKPRKKKKTSSRKYNCPECGTSIRASKDVNILCGDCTDIEEGKVVMMIKELTEEDFEDGENGEGEETEGTNEPVETTLEYPVEIVCCECGCVSSCERVNFKGCFICPECKSTNTQEVPAPIEEPEAPVEVPVEEEPTPAGIVEVETELNDGAGNMIPVKQGMIAVEHRKGLEGFADKYIKKKKIKPVEEVKESENTGWTAGRIDSELLKIKSLFEVEGLNAPNLIEDEIDIEISEKLNSQWALYKEGKKIVFSKKYIEEASDSEIADTIKHQYIHHYQFKVEGLKINHKKEFKALCKQFGLSLEVPTKNHRAMK